MTPPVAGLVPAPDSPGRYSWLTTDRLPRVRGILLGITLFFGLAVWVFHSVMPERASDLVLVRRLRGVGVMTWLFALVQLVDLRIWHSRFARRRLATSGLPESVLGLLVAQMLPWFGIVYYGLTMDVSWYIAGMAIFLGSFVVFPIASGD